RSTTPTCAVSFKRLLGGNVSFLAAIGEAPRQYQEKHERRDATTRGGYQEPGQALGSDPIPVVQAKTDIARDKRADVGVLGDPDLPSLQQSRQGPAADVDLDAISALSQRYEHGLRRPPDVAATRELRTERDGGNEEERRAHGQKEEPNARGHRSLHAREDVLLPNGSRLSCGRNAGGGKAAEPPVESAGEGTQFFRPERPAASSAC